MIEADSDAAAVPNGHVEFGDGEVILSCDRVAGTIHANYFCAGGQIVRDPTVFSVSAGGSVLRIACIHLFRIGVCKMPEFSHVERAAQAQ